MGRETEQNIAFIDESGDSGFRLGKGSSPYFTASLVLFKDTMEALRCDKKIEQLRQGMHWSVYDEFHFKANSDQVRHSFLEAVRVFDFRYYGFVIDKQMVVNSGFLFKDKLQLYQYAYEQVCRLALLEFRNTTLIIDQTGGADFYKRLASHLRRQLNTSGRIIKKIKMQDSKSNNLLQLADYVAAVVNRSISQVRPLADKYRSSLVAKEVEVRVLPE